MSLRITRRRMDWQLHSRFPAWLKRLKEHLLSPQHKVKHAWEWGGTWWEGLHGSEMGSESLHSPTPPHSQRSALPRRSQRSTLLPVIALLVVSYLGNLVEWRAMSEELDQGMAVLQLVIACLLMM